MYANIWMQHGGRASRPPSLHSIIAGMGLCAFMLCAPMSHAGSDQLTVKVVLEILQPTCTLASDTIDVQLGNIYDSDFTNIEKNFDIKLIQCVDTKGIKVSFGGGNRIKYSLDNGLLFNIMQGGNVVAFNQDINAINTSGQQAFSNINIPFTLRVTRDCSTTGGNCPMLKPGAFNTSIPFTVTYE